MSNLLKQAVSAAENGTAVGEAEAAKIGAAADRKRRRENEKSLNAVLKSEETGKAVYWTRTNRANGETRPVLMSERAGAYGERRFLRLCEKAAGQAARGEWQNPERVEAVAAELVSRILTKTQGVMPKVGSLGRSHEGHENPDLAYLTTAAKRLIINVTEGDPRGAGLAGEVAIYSADSTAQGATPVDLASIASEAVDSAEGDTDPYLADSEGDFFTNQALGAASKLSAISGRREAAQQAAIAAALRPNLRAADLANAGHATTGGALRKAASIGRTLLGETLAGIYATPVERWTDEDWRTAEALATVCAEDECERVSAPLMEQGPKPYRRPIIVWPADCDPVPRAERV